MVSPSSGISTDDHLAAIVSRLLRRAAPCPAARKIQDAHGPGLRVGIARSSQIKPDWFGVRESDEADLQDDLLGLAELMVAVVDGLAIQHALHESFAPGRPHGVLAKILRLPSRAAALNLLVHCALGR
jgi:hypothetical protein